MKLKLNPLKVQAAVFVALFTAGIVAIILLAQLFVLTFGIQGVAFAAMAFMVVMAVKMMYEMRLGQLEARERLKDISERH